jgi:hypothetical protein
MKTLRISAALYLYETLLTRGQFRRDWALSVLPISSSTFKRVLSDLRCYLAEYHPEKEIVFEEKEEAYFLRSICP